MIKNKKAPTYLAERLRGCKSGYKIIAYSIAKNNSPTSKK